MPLSITKNPATPLKTQRGPNTLAGQFDHVPTAGRHQAQTAGQADGSPPTHIRVVSPGSRGGSPGVGYCLPESEAVVESLIGRGSWLGRQEFCEPLRVHDEGMGQGPEELASLSFQTSAPRPEPTTIPLAVGLFDVEIVDPLAGGS